MPEKEFKIWLEDGLEDARRHREAICGVAYGVRQTAKPVGRCCGRN